MDRREFLSRTVWGAIPVALFGSPLWGQQPQQGQQPLGQAVIGPAPGPAPARQVDPRVTAILGLWEKNTAGINRMSGSFSRMTYDDVFGVEKRSVGQFMYEAPDKGRIDLNAVELPKSAINQGKQTSKGVNYKVVADDPQRWVCTGTQVLVIDDTSKSVQQVDIPPQYQGQNIVDGPLPFLFGIKAEKAERRYQLEIGSRHSAEIYHLVAKPLLRQDAQEWSVAEVMLNPQTFLPQAIRTFDPAGTKETVYVFNADQKVNPRWIFDPFTSRNLGISNYKVTKQTTAEVAPEMRTVPKSVIK